MRIFRTLILIAGAGLLMPSPPEDAAVANPEAAAENISTANVLFSATSAFADAASFCTRQPGVCETAGYVAARLEAKAKYSVRLLYEWAQDDGEGQAVGSDPLTTGSNSTVAAGQSTLKLEDLIPEWRGPKSRKG